MLYINDMELLKIWNNLTTYAFASIRFGFLQRTLEILSKQIRQHLCLITNTHIIIITGKTDAAR